MSEYSQNGREVGHITSVSNYRVTVLMDQEIKSQVRSYPHRIAIVTQIGGYLLFPVAPGESVVGIITGASENEAMEPNESEKEGMLLQFIRNRRTMALNLVGQIKEANSPEQVKFEPGISTYPNLGTPVLLPSEKELVSILEYKDFDRDKKQDCPLVIGDSPIYRQQNVSASFNNLFAHSFGIIGNTGSGKSWSVASIIQSAIRKLEKDSNPKFIILDINGEYQKAFPCGKSIGSDQEAVNRVLINGQSFNLPLWMFNLNEFISFFEASQSSQIPVLERVVTLIREDAIDPPARKSYRKSLYTIERCLGLLARLFRFAGETDGNYVFKNTLETLAQLKDDSEKINILKDYSEAPKEISQIKNDIQLLCSKMKEEESKGNTGYSHLENCIATEIFSLVEKFEPLFRDFRFQIISKGCLQEITADTPVKFDLKKFEEEIFFDMALSRYRGQERIQEYISTLKLRIHRQLVDKRWTVFTEENKKSQGNLFENIVQQMTGDEHSTVVVDCSMLAYDVLPFFCAVFARILLELRSRMELSKRITQPYVLVLEEAHNYLRPSKHDEKAGFTLARETFERIAKEGRKFGLSLLIASQRPSEISATVLSQCANFLVHRIQNPEDIEYFKEILPLGSRTLLDQLPILPPGQGLLLGSSVNIPTRIQMRKPDPAPTSETSKPWNAWQPGSEKLNVKEIASKWKKITENNENPEEKSNYLEEPFEEPTENDGNPEGDNICDEPPF